jgi:hypothetical protein
VVLHFMLNLLMRKKTSLKKLRPAQTVFNLFAADASLVILVEVIGQSEYKLLDGVRSLMCKSFSR